MRWESTILDEPWRWPHHVFCIVVCPLFCSIVYILLFPIFDPKLGIGSLENWHIIRSVATTVLPVFYAITFPWFLAHFSVTALITRVFSTSNRAANLLIQLVVSGLVAYGFWLTFTSGPVAPERIWALTVFEFCALTSVALCWFSANRLFSQI